MSKSVHGHEVMEMMITSKESFTKESLESAIGAKFGNCVPDKSDTGKSGTEICPESGHPAPGGEADRPGHGRFPPGLWVDVEQCRTKPILMPPFGWISTWPQYVSPIILDSANHEHIEFSHLHDFF